EKQRRLQQALRRDLIAHGDAEEHKRLGDLLLANIAGARRAGNRVTIVDYFAEGAPELELEIDENHSLQEEAVRRYQKYGKSKRAAEEINRRLKEIEQEAARIEREQERAEKMLAERNYESLTPVGEQSQNARPETGKPAQRKPDDEALRGLKRYRSSDGYEVLVGRGARDNDRLTFRIARSHDLWLHAADYPGAHVVVVNHDRHHGVPQRTIIEAAQLAAHNSQARDDTKVNVHYTERKHLAKPRGAAPGLVRMSHFRTMLVEPREAIPRI
ncbi:MAG: NFACT RNA binding domain-containing protein, partial [Pyrinomonadaceae bacterium]